MGSGFFDVGGPVKESGRVPKGRCVFANTHGFGSRLLSVHRLGTVQFKYRVLSEDFFFDVRYKG